MHTSYAYDLVIDALYARVSHELGGGDSSTGGAGQDSSPTPEYVINVSMEKRSGIDSDTILRCTPCRQFRQRCLFFFFFSL